MSLKKKPRKRLIGYARISTKQQDLARQIKALKRVGCDPIRSDTASGKSMAGRPALAAALDELDAGDALVIAEWDRATRSMWDGLQIIKAVIDAGATIKVLDRSYIDLTTPMGRGFMAMMSAMAEDERLRIVKRTHEGRQIARQWREDGAQAEAQFLSDQGSAPAPCQRREDPRSCQGLRRQYQHDCAALILGGTAIAWAVLTTGEYTG
jgi:predicted site-specific integrase-resolvase